jgi:thioredoxin reductase/ferredoxin
MRNELIYGTLAAGGIALHLYQRRRLERAARAEHESAARAGLNEPPSLHPVIDPARCIGSAGCTRACPESALGIIDGKAVLVNAAACIGHGACKVACPVDAITLVFGTERRGIDIPPVSPQFESNVPGIFIAGELGGMGLIRKAAEQGRQAVEGLRSRRASADELELLIVGAGPAGLSAALAAKQHGLRYRIIEQEDSLGGTVYHYPRHKIAATVPMQLATVGRVRMANISKEQLLTLWSGIVEKAGLKVHFRERMERVERQGDSFLVHTSAGVHRTRSLLLAIGRRGTPRKLNVPGENSPKVVYRLIDAAQYRGRSVLVVGGGDAALEAALALAGQTDTRVQLSYRGAGFSRAKELNRNGMQEAVDGGRVELLLNSEVVEIMRSEVKLKTAAGSRVLPNDAVIVCAGGELPIPLLQQMGIEFQTKHGTA